MAETTRPEPLFIGDHRALDLLNTTATDRGVQLEWLGNGRDFVEWLSAAGLIPPVTAAQTLAEISADDLNAQATAARDMRERFRGFVERHSGTTLGPEALEDLEWVNAVLARDHLYRQIETVRDKIPDGTSALALREGRRFGTPEDLLIPLADVIADAVCNADFRRIRNCEAPECSLWFLDVSKNQKRRWCSMKVCGNRAKAAAHRQRANPSF